MSIYYDRECKKDQEKENTKKEMYQKKEWKISHYQVKQMIKIKIYQIFKKKNRKKNKFKNFEKMLMNNKKIKNQKINNKNYKSS